MITVWGIKVFLFTILLLQTSLCAGGRKGGMISKQEAIARMEKKLFPECLVCALCQIYLDPRINGIQGKISSEGFKTLLQQVSSWHKKGHRTADPVVCSPQRNEEELDNFEKNAQKELRRSGNNI